MGGHSEDSLPTSLRNIGYEEDGRGGAGEEYARLSSSDRRFLKQLGEEPLLGTLSVEEERARMRAGQSAALSEYAVEAREFQTSACAVQLIRPREASGPLPILFFLHGGGWVLGDVHTHLRLVCELALRCGSVVAFVDYPRAPEHPFPLPLEACVAAWSEILQAAERLGLDEKRFAIGGDSSGGNLAAAAVLLAIERELTLPARMILLYPAMDYGGAGGSHDEFRSNPNLSEFTMRWFWESYVPDRALGSDPRVSPLRAGNGLLARFPPTLIVTCEYDILRNEGEQFAERLCRAGVDVTATRWLGSLHGFLVTESLAASVSAETCLDMVAQYIKRGWGGR